MKNILHKILYSLIFVSDGQILPDKLKRVLRTKQLVENLNVDKILNILYQQNVIDKQEYEKIEQTGGGRTKQVLCFIDIMEIKSDWHFYCQSIGYFRK